MRPVTARPVGEGGLDQAVLVAAPVARQRQRAVDAAGGDLERVGHLAHHVGLVEHPRDLAGRVGDVVEGDPAVLVDGDAQHAALARGGDLDGLDVEAHRAARGRPAPLRCGPGWRPVGGCSSGCDLLVQLSRHHDSGRRPGPRHHPWPVRTGAAGRARVRGCPDARSPVVRRWARHSSLPCVLAACDIDPPSRGRSVAADAAPPPPEDSELVAAVVAALVRAQVGARGRDARPSPPSTPAPGAGRRRARRAPRGPRRRGPRRGRRDHRRRRRRARRSAPGADGGAALRAAAAARGAPRAASARASGDLARVLASVAASTAQHAAALADPGRPGAAVTVLDALQATLADEHAALYTYGVLGARTSQAATPALLRRRSTAGLPPPPRAPRPAAAAGRGRRRRTRRRRRRPTTLDGPLLRRAAGRGVPQWRSRPRASRRCSSLVAQSIGAVREWALTEATWSATWQPRARRRPPRPGRGLPSSTALRAACPDVGSPTQGKRPAASAFGKVPRSLPKAEDADRSWGWSASPCVAPPVGVVEPHAQSCIRSARMGKRTALACSCNARSCRSRTLGRRGRPPQAASNRRTTAGISASDVTRGVRARPRCGRPASAGIVLTAARGSPSCPALCAPQTSSKSRSPT